MLPLWARVDLGVMAMNSPRLLHYWSLNIWLFNVIFWTLIREVLALCRYYIQCILQLQLTVFGIKKHSCIHSKPIIPLYLTGNSSFDIEFTSEVSFTRKVLLLLSKGFPVKAGSVINIGKDHIMFDQKVNIQITSMDSIVWISWEMIIKILEDFVLLVGSNRKKADKRKKHLKLININVRLHRRFWMSTFWPNIIMLCNLFQHW